MNQNFLSRIGTFFLLIGFGLLIIFVGSIFAKEINLVYLMAAGIVLFLGYIFHHAAPRPEPRRFSAIRNARRRSQQKREDKQAKDEEKGNE
jgi:fatty acid desaturase